MNETIEVEVLEVDGAAPQRPAPAPEPTPEAPWRSWQGRVRKLDARWWPLWIVLGVIALFLVLTVGVVLAVVFLVIKIIAGVVGSIFQLFSGGASTSGTSLRQ